MARYMMRMRMKMMGMKMKLMIMMKKIRRRNEEMRETPFKVFFFSLKIS